MAIKKHAMLVLAFIPIGIVGILVATSQHVLPEDSDAKATNASGQSEHASCPKPVRVTIDGIAFEIPREELNFVILTDGSRLDGSDAICDAPLQVVRIHLSAIILGKIEYPPSTWERSRELLTRGRSFSAWENVFGTQLSEVTEDLWREVFALETNILNDGVVEHRNQSSVIYEFPAGYFPRSSKNQPSAAICHGHWIVGCEISFFLDDGIQFYTRPLLGIEQGAGILEALTDRLNAAITRMESYRR